MRPTGIPLWAVALVVALDLAILISTIAWQAPLHGKLDREGYSGDVIKRLVLSNWIRTILWTVNALLLLSMTAQALLAVK